tara:strand:+ start:10294 stop:12816 length:2523 start_codon:yes stop_codon:yes gene_type:complete
MATKKFSDLTTTTSPNSASIFAIAYDNSNFGVTLTNIAANLPAVTAASITSSSTLTTTGNATIGGDLTITGDDLFMGTNTSGAALIADGTNFNPVVISGDIAIATNGAATIQADAVEGSMLNDNVISGQTEISSGLADADELLYSDAGTLKKVGMDTMKTYFSPVAGSSSIVTTGTISSGTWEATDIGVAHGGTGASSLTANGVLIGNGTSAVTAVDLSTKGKLLIGDGSGNPSALSVGSNNHVLTADSSEGTGMKWAAVPASTPTDITVADESTDTTCFPLFVTAATGDLGPKTGSNLAFNSSSGLLTATGFSGPLTGNVTGNASGSSGSCTGNSATATTSTNVTVADESSDTTCFPLFVTAATGDLAPKSASGLTFNSNTDVLSGTFSGNITGNVTGNTSGSSGSCTGNAATATALETARNIGGVSFDGTGNINLPGVNTAGNQNTSGTAAVATTVTITDNESTNEDNALIFTSGGDVDGGNIGLESDGTCTYNPSTGSITATGFIGALTGNASGSSGSCTGNAATATALATARNIGGVSFDGTGNIDLPGVNSAGNQNTSGNAAGLSATLAVGSGGTGATSLTANGVIIGNGTSALTSVDLSTKGKILVGDGSGNPQALAVGTNTHVLTADSSEATGLKWAEAGGGGGGGLVVESAVNFYGSGGSSVATYSYTGFDSDYDNYWVFIHGISFDNDGGNLDFRWLDDGAAVTGAGYRVSAVGIDSNGTARNISENNTTSASLTSAASNGADAAPLTGWFYFPNGRGGRWDSDSNDSEGQVKPYMDFHLGYKNSSNYHEVVTGSLHQDDTACNSMNGFQLIATSQNFRKICLTVYGVARS